MKKNISIKKLTLSKKTVSDLSTLSGGFQLSETFEPNCETSPIICLFPQESVILEDCLIP